MSGTKLIDPGTGLEYRAGGSQDASGNTITAATPPSSSTAAITPVVGSAVTSLVVKNAPGNLFGASMTNGATAGFLIAYNAIAAPSGGAGLTAGLILAAVPVAANGFASIGGNAYPDRFGIGITLLFSTSTTTYTVPGNAALHMRGSAA